MATLTSSYQYLGRSSVMTSKSGSLNYYLLLYGKTTANKTTGIHTVSIKGRLASTNSNATFYSYNTSYSGAVAGKTAFSGTGEPKDAWEYNSSSGVVIGGVTYKTYTDIGSGSVNVDCTNGLSKDIKLSFTWKMPSNNSASYTPAAGTSRTVSVTATLSAIPRASSPTISTSSVSMGNALTITTNRLSSSFTHTLKYTFCGTTQTIAEDVGDSHSWTVPDLASLCNNEVGGSCTITCITYSGSTEIGTKTCTVTLNVPAATTPTLPTSTASSPKYAGEEITITLPRRSTNFTHRLTYSFSNASGTIGIYPTSASWTIPYSLCSQIPSTWSGNITITCVTYNGTATVGTTTASLYFHVPDNSTTKPTISGITLAPVSSLASPFDKLYIHGMSKVKATYNTSTPYSTLESVEMSVQSKLVEGTSTTATSGYLSSGSNVAVTLTVKNARGQTTIGTATISTIYEYNKPLVVASSSNAKVICSRGNDDGTVSNDGMNLVINAKRQYSSIGGNNSCTLWYRIKAYNGLPFADGAEKITLLSANDSSDEFISALSDVTISTTTSYTVEVGVSDQLSDDASIVFFIPTTEATFHLAKGGKGASFGGYSKGSGLEVLWKSTFTGAVQGNAYGLGSLPVIPQNSDINDYTTPGVYSIISNAYAQTMSNLPNIRAGRLIVSSADGSGRSNGTWAYLLQEYITFDGVYRYSRLIRTGETADKWMYDNWQCNSSTDWVDLGLSSNVSASTYDIGRSPYGCGYRVENENHVYVAFNCAYRYSNVSFRVNNLSIPEKYFPTRRVYSICPAGGKYIARIFVTESGNVWVEWVQNLLSNDETESLEGTLIDGYIDYWL